MSEENSRKGQSQKPWWDLAQLGLEKVGLEKLSLAIPLVFAGFAGFTGVAAVAVNYLKATVGESKETEPLPPSLDHHDLSNERVLFDNFMEESKITQKNLKILVVGAQHAGKSCFINSLLSIFAECSVSFAPVGDVEKSSGAHLTTAIDFYPVEKTNWVLIDTPGLNAETFHKLSGRRKTGHRKFYKACLGKVFSIIL
eukprot:TRINITY_DN13282_c0_g1_i1.p1 TRINITY_DN13282_c0_g1~~TRINITY_DN13282_c0_g1_i1.p1  ORF type:complete len:198 (-),score=21.68 TRINITY_DN13282_c0_g1_i1:113-706(-)